jgi:Big-like domain-containing protein
VNVSIAAVNDAPVALDGSLAVNAGASASGTLDATDIDSAVLARAIVANGAKGSAIVTDTATGAFTYTANPGTSGLDTFTFKANDGALDSNIATVTVTITPATLPCAPPVDVTARVKLNLNRPRLDAVPGHFSERIRIENRTGAPITGPVSFVLDGLTEGTTIPGASGFTDCASPTGSPFITVDLGDGVLNDRERLEFVVEFVNERATAITYTARVLAGPGSR